MDDDLAGWLGHREAVVGRRRTMNRYRSLLAHHVSPTLDHVEVQQVTTADVDELYVAMIRAGLARATVRQLHAVLGKALSDAEVKGVIVRNPVRHASPPSMAGANDEMTVWTPAELAQFFELAAEHRLVPLWRLAAMTGMRRGEICGLRWSAVDLTQGVVRVERTRTTAGGAEIVESEPKSQRSRRVITLDRETTRVLSSHRGHEDQIAVARRTIDSLRDQIHSTTVDIEHYAVQLRDLQVRLERARAVGERRPAWETQLIDLDSCLNDDRRTRTRQIRPNPPAHVTNALGPRPAAGHPARAWDNAAGQLDQHHTAFDINHGLGLEPRVGLARTDLHSRELIRASLRTLASRSADEPAAHDLGLGDHGIDI